MVCEALQCIGYRMCWCADRWFGVRRYAISFTCLCKSASVDKREFTEDIEQSDQVTDIALMDTESARIFGNRKIGSLSDVVSQYEIEADYTQISIKGQPMKVSGLKYASFFKWWNNRNSGVPGYVQVNPVNSEAKYVKLTKPMKYVPRHILIIICSVMCSLLINQDH